jgi:hypothetical protein
MVPWYCADGMKTEMLTLPGPCTRTTVIVRNEHQAGISTVGDKMSKATFKSWGRWFLSVLCTSMFMSYMSIDQTSNLAAAKSTLSPLSSKSEILNVAQDSSAHDHRYPCDPQIY